ncbi:MAG: hypothetical protein D6798_15185 [Deltaproteobacteria bacterium]|nr:MAG: hypothetical protein D6798_15185 [Deltaproteobacteria bacterium]
MLIHRALGALVDLLLERELLVLVDGATPVQVRDELVAALDDQAAFAQVGPFVSAVLLSSALVDELFADDRQIAALLSDVEL